MFKKLSLLFFALTQATALARSSSAPANRPLAPELETAQAAAPTTATLAAQEPQPNTPTLLKMVEDDLPKFTAGASPDSFEALEALEHASQVVQKYKPTLEKYRSTIGKLMGQLRQGKDEEKTSSIISADMQQQINDILSNITHDLTTKVQPKALPGKSSKPAAVRSRIGADAPASDLTEEAPLDKEEAGEMLVEEDRGTSLDTLDLILRKTNATVSSDKSGTLDAFVTRIQQRINAANELIKIMDHSKQSELRALIRSSSEKIKPREFTPAFTEVHYKQDLDKSTMPLVTKIREIIKEMKKQLKD